MCTVRKNTFLYFVLVHISMTEEWTASGHSGDSDMSVPRHISRARSLIESLGDAVEQVGAGLGTETELDYAVFRLIYPTRLDILAQNPRIETIREVGYYKRGRYTERDLRLPIDTNGTCYALGYVPKRDHPERIDLLLKGATKRGEKLVSEVEGRRISFFLKPEEQTILYQGLAGLLFKLESPDQLQPGDLDLHAEELKYRTPAIDIRTGSPTLELGDLIRLSDLNMLIQRLH